jgi:hypothetical protein
MKTIPIKRNHFYIACTLQLGGKYTLFNTYNTGTTISPCKPRTGTLIRTGTKGFNFLDPKTYKCILKRSVYQLKTSSPIKRNQFLFELRLPVWISKITTGQCQSKTIDTPPIPKEPIILPTKKVNQIIGALYRMEL